MPRHRSLNLKKFIDSIPDFLLEEYFRQRIKGGAPLKSFSYTSVSKFLESITDEELRSSIDEDFTHINDISEKMMNILNSAVRRYRIKTTGEETREHLAMDIFLHHKKAFDYAYDYYCFLNSSSKMSHYNVMGENFGVTPEKIERFKKRIQKFYSELAKGQECLIRHHDDKDQSVIVVMHGSYKRSLPIWDNQKVKTAFFRPANEDILQYNKSTSILSIKAPHKKDKDNYIDVFTKTILEDDSQAERPDRDTAYTLEPLRNGTFSFAGNDAITSINLLEVKLSMRGVTTPNVVIKSKDVFKTLEHDLTGITLRSGDLVHAKFKFELDVEGKQRRVTFEITPPNVTDLTRKKYADIIGAYLKENGVKLV